jgi:uncharacterized protein (TIGR03435 family)
MPLPKIRFSSLSRPVWEYILSRVQESTMSEAFTCELVFGGSLDVVDDQKVGREAALCGGLVPLPHGPGQISKFGARNVTLGFIASQLSIMGQLVRHAIDQTALTGNFDFSLEWSPEPANPTPAADALPGPTFAQALGEQLGLKLVARTDVV